MGNSHGKIFRVILLTLLLLPLLAFSDTGSGVAATLADFTLPHYRNNDLQFVLYGQRAVNLGAIITIYNPLIDIVVRKLPDVEVITILKDMKAPDLKNGSARLEPMRLYPLYAGYDIVREFWKQAPHSQALIITENAVYDKNKRTMSGDGQVYFRSRDMDVDGLGFDANQEAKFVHIRRNVRVIFRPNARPLTEESKKLLEEKWNVLKAKNSR